MENKMRILIARTDKIGDLVLSIPSFFMIRKMYPEAEITVLVRNYNYEIVKNLPYIDRVVKIDDYRKEELLEKIAYFKADVFIALYNDKFVSQLAKASRAKLRIGPYSKLYSLFTFNKGVWQKRSKSIKNEAEYNLDLVKKMNPKLFTELLQINTEIYLEESNRKVADLFFQEKEIKGKSLIINPFMGGSAKNIKDEEYAAIIKKVLEKLPEIDVVILCHISEHERGERLVEMTESSRVHLFANGGSLLNIAAIIEKGTLYFGGSTGPTHIAGSLKKNIVAIYPKLKTQSPKRWGVFGNENVEYIVVDENNPKENYSHKNFDSYSDDVEDRIVSAIVEKLSD